MKGLELSRRYYEEFGRDAIRSAFPDAYTRIAVGLVGEGSECFGYDDDISTDHDFEPAFCLWVTPKDYEAFGFNLERVYAKLPKEFLGYSRLTVSPVGGNRHGVHVIEDFYARFLGMTSLPQTLEEWLYIPTESLAAASNGEVFYDELMAFSTIRNTLKAGYPEDVRLKKIAAHLVMLEQSGLYNYARSVKRLENGTAQLCVFNFVKHAISLIYLLNNVYEPFYKWSYRKMRELPTLGYLENSLVSLTELGNSKIEAEAKTDSMEEIARVFVDELNRQAITNACGCELERHAVSVQNKIRDARLRNMHIMAGI